MVIANRDIILLNKRLDRASRRDLYEPTQISGVSIYNNRQSSVNRGFHSETEKFKIRIPIDAQVQDGKQYIPETHYDELGDDEKDAYWTLHNEDLIIVLASGFEDVNTSVFETALTTEQAEEMADSVGFQKELVHIVDYSDNTLRGSEAVRHWRIGGA